MATEFGLEIVSPVKSIAATKCLSLTIPGSQGYMTILPDHTAMVSELGVGHMVATDSTSKAKESYFLSGGFVEVKGDTVVVMADVVEVASEIDVAGAEADKKKALEALEGKGQVELDQSSKALKEAEYRIRVAKSVASSN